ncbi:MAG: FHA domain-containing protein [Victivallales bacterium]|nr:FHA domain-containing protein [Victivallales bacterium]
MATAKIQILSDGPMRGNSFQLPNESYTIGRSDSCDICIPDATISGHHCTLFQADEGVYMIRDEGSTNGSSLNGEPLEPGQEMVLKQGDIFQLGGIEIMFDTGEFTQHTKSQATGHVIDLENTGTGEVTKSSMKNMAGSTTTKRTVMLRENKGHNAIWYGIIALLGLIALGVAGLVFSKML